VTFPGNYRATAVMNHWRPIRPTRIATWKLAAPAPTMSAFSIWGEALAESKAAPAPALNPAARSFHLPSSAPMDPTSAPFCPEKKVPTLVVKSSALPDDTIVVEDSSQRSAWKQTKGAPCKVAKTPAGNVVPRSLRNGRVSAARPPTPPRTRSSSAIKRQPADKIGKKADAAPSHLKKHLDVLQSVPLVRSGLSDLLDGLAVLPSVTDCADPLVLPGEGITA
jgi:hypothetical protein